jgi:hypothetical protein
MAGFATNDAPGGRYRIEEDALGEVRVPADRL